jgi:WD40 repeat protein
MQGREESILDHEMRDARILEKTKMLSELTEQRDILQPRMAETHTSKEEETYQNILRRIAEIEADLVEEKRIAKVVPLTRNSIALSTRSTTNFAISTPEECKVEEIQYSQSIGDITASEEARAQTRRKLLDDKQALQSLENLIKRLHQLFINSFDSKAFNLYIEPQVKDRDTGMEFPSAFKRLGDFVVQADAASMLVAGDPGMGKTLLSLQITQHSWYLFIRENIGNLLKAPYWVDVLAAYEKQGLAQIVAPLFPKADEKSEAPIPQKTISLPLWLWMPFLRTEENWEPQLLETHLKQSGLFPEDIALLKQSCQQHLLHLLPIMDGWDELPPVKENLYLLSGFWEEERWPYLKVLSTCRPEAFVYYEKQGGYKSIFHPRPGAGAYTILNLSPFESRHTDAYINCYVSTLPENYQPSILVSVPAVAVKQNKAWDKAKADWISDYQAHYFPLQNSPKVADKTAKLGDEKEEEIAAATAVDVHSNEEQPIDWRSAQTYKYHLEHISGLSQLIQTPFILSAVVQVLPNIVMHHIQHHGQSQQTITRYTIYQYFVDYWLTTQAKRLWRDKEKQWALIDFRMENEAESIEKLKACLFTYSENLARLALNLGRGKVEVNLSDKDTLNPNLVIPASGVLHFKEELVDVKKLQLIRSGCLLQTLGNTFKFLHKSLVEFFAAKTLFSGAHVAVDSYLRYFDMEKSLNKDLSLNEQLLTSEPNIIYLLADQARHDLDFKYLLYQIIELSKGEPSVEKAAANAITILNAAGESFSGRDFRGIHIRGAILNGALCDQTDFEGADLRDVTVHNAWMQKVNLSYAQVSGLDFQESLRIKRNANITSLCVSSNGAWLLIGDAGGYVTQYSYPEGKLLQKWEICEKMFIGGVVAVLHSNDKLFACGGDFPIQLIHIQKKPSILYFTPPIIKQHHRSIDSSQSHSECITFCYEQEQYLAFSISIMLFTKIGEIDDGPMANLGHSEILYTGNHLQLWDIKQHRFLGEYTGTVFIKLSTCNQGYTLIAETNNSKILLFSLLDYRDGPLTPVQEFKANCFALSSVINGDEQSKNGHLLALLQKKRIQFYQTDAWKYFLPDTISLTGKQECKSLAFSPQNNLLAGRSSRHLHLWDLDSGHHLYALPIPESNSLLNEQNFLYFLPCTDVLHVCVASGNTLYIWPLGRNEVSICYPRYAINLPVTLLEKTQTSKVYYGLKTPLLFIEKYEEEENNKNLKIKVQNILTGEIRELLCKSKSLNIPLDSRFYISSKEKYLAHYVKFTSFFNFTYTYTYVWDLRTCHLHFKITHAEEKKYFDATSLLHFSADEEWLIDTDNRDKLILIYRLKDGKKLMELSTGFYISDFVLHDKKHWLAVADQNCDLSVFDMATQKCLFRLNKLPIVIRDLRLTQDSQLLMASNERDKEKEFSFHQNKKEDKEILIFRAIQENGGLNFKLIHSSMKLNLVCGELKIEGIYGLSHKNKLLLEQNNVRGIPVPFVEPVTPLLESKEAEQGKKPNIGRELGFDRAVVRRDDVSSFLNVRAVLNYDVWQVALVRDKESRSNNEHTFIVVEGMDTFGRCFFWRFDLVTKIGEERVEKGFAKVDIQRYNDLLLSERKSILQVFLNPHEIQGRGLESLVGLVWQLKREKVLDLYKAVVADQKKGLLPYAITGNQSFFSTGDNCYSWARRHLLALKEPKIQKELPSTSADYFVIRPKWKLQESLVAAQHAKREATSGLCRPM